MVCALSNICDREASAGVSHGGAHPLTRLLHHHIRQPLADIDLDHFPLKPDHGASAPGVRYAAISASAAAPRAAAGLFGPYIRAATHAPSISSSS
jgi:hypothetical protein